MAAEKHPNSMLKFLIDKTFNKIFKNYHSEKISQSMQAKYRAELIKEFRRFYGEWINVYDINMKKGIFHTNFEAVYKTENGRLYGNAPGSVQDHIFYTSHCFEQYQERGNCYNTYPLLVLAYKRIRNTEPTEADILRFMAINADQFCHTDSCVYVNIFNGVLVFEKLSYGILIGKTFLLPDMDYPKKGWYRSAKRGIELDMTDEGKKFQEICEKGMKINNEPLVKPEFLPGELATYNEYVQCLQSMVKLTLLDF